MLIVFGWFSICGASYDYGDRDFLDFSTRAGKQFMWIVCSFGLGFILLMLEDTLYDMFSYIIYIGLILLLVVTIFIAPDTKGSRSWLILGPVSLQPAEFAKFATALALAKYMSAYSFTIKSWKSALMLAFLILLPMTLIILQRETGSALVYMAFFLMLYREGMPGVVLFSGICAVVYFVVGIRFDQVFIADTPTPIGEFVVLSMILLFAGGMVWVYKKKWEPVRNIIVGSFIVLLVAYLVSVYVFVALRCVPFCVPFLWSKSELLCSGWHNSSFIKNTKKRPLHKNVQRPLTIQAMLLNNAQEQAITEQPLLPRSA